MKKTNALKEVAVLTALEECIDLRSGKTPARNRPEFWSGAIPWFSAKDLKSFQLADSEEHISDSAVADGAPIASAGDILMLVRGMTLMKDVPVGVLSRDASFNQDLKSLRPSRDVSSNYLGYMLAASRPRLLAMVDQAGHGTGRLAVERLLSLPIWKPSAKAQWFIEDLLSQHDKVLQLSQALIDAKRTFKSGLARQLLTGKRRFPKFQTDKWKAATLGDVVTFKPRKVEKPAGKFLSAGVRSHGKGMFLKPEFPSDRIALDELFELRQGDLVVNITFGWEGAIAIVPPEADRALVSHRFPTYEVDEGKILIEFLHHIIRMKRFVFDVGVASPGGAGRNRVLNRSEFLSIGIQLPSIGEQQRIASTLNDCDSEIDLLGRFHQQVALQKRALLSRLLTGELIVPSS